MIDSPFLKNKFQSQTHDVHHSTSWWQLKSRVAVNVQRYNSPLLTDISNFTATFSIWEIILLGLVFWILLMFWLIKLTIICFSSGNLSLNWYKIKSTQTLSLELYLINQLRKTFCFFINYFVFSQAYKNGGSHFTPCNSFSVSLICKKKKCKMQVPCIDFFSTCSAWYGSCSNFFYWLRHSGWLRFAPNKTKKHVHVFCAF